VCLIDIFLRNLIVKCCALPGSGLRLKANRVRGFRGSGGKVRGERNPKLKSTYFRGSSPLIYTSSKLPSCNTDYKSKPSKNPLEYSFLSTESSGIFHNFPPNSINNLPELSDVFHPLPYYILSSVSLHHMILPFHSSHLTQSLDARVFDALKKQMAVEIEPLMQTCCP